LVLDVGLALDLDLVVAAGRLGAKRSEGQHERQGAGQEETRSRQEPSSRHEHLPPPVRKGRPRCAHIARASQVKTGNYSNALSKGQSRRAGATGANRQSFAAVPPAPPAPRKRHERVAPALAPT